MKKIGFWKETLLLTGMCLLVLGPARAQESKNFARFLEPPKDFDGVADTLAVNLPDAARSYKKLTYSAWIYPRMPEGAVANRSVLDQGGRVSISTSSYDEKNKSVLERMVRLQGAIFTQNADGRYSYKDVACPVSAAADKWSHVAITYDQEYLRFFLDGKETAALKESGALSDYGSRPLNIGRCNWSERDFWAGMLSDIRIYDAALEPGQIAKLASAPPLPPAAGTVFRSDTARTWVLNGGFEGEYSEQSAGKSTPGWWNASAWGKPVAKFTKETDNPHSGKAAQKIDCTEFPESTASGGMSVWQTAWVPFKPGRTYTLDMWLRSDFDSEATFLIQGGPDNAMLLGKTVQADRRWKKYSASVSYSGVPAAGRVLIFYGSKRPGNLMIDDVSVSVE